MKKILFIIISFGIILQTGCKSDKKDSQQSMKGDISISGAFALYPMVIKWKEEFNKIYPDIHIDISAGGAGKGMADALSDIVNLGMVSREISPEEIARGAWFVPVAKDAVVGVINKDNPVINDILTKGMSKETLIRIFVTREIKTWGEAVGVPQKSRDKIQLFTRSDACGAAEIWAKYLGKNQEDLKGVGVFGDPGIAQAVQKDVHGIGYNNICFAYNPKTKNMNENLCYIPLDLNADYLIDKSENFYSHEDSLIRAVADGIYPSPPARDLYMVSRSKPTSVLVITFLRWILTDGQKYVNESGYIKLTDEKIKNAMDKLK